MWCLFLIIIIDKKNWIAVWCKKKIKLLVHVFAILARLWPNPSGLHTQCPSSLKVSNIKRNRHCFLLPIQIEDFFFRWCYFCRLRWTLITYIVLKCHSSVRFSPSLDLVLFLCLHGNSVVAVGFFSDWIDDISFLTLYLFGCACTVISKRLFLSLLPTWNSGTPILILFLATQIIQNFHYTFSLEWDGIRKKLNKRYVLNLNYVTYPYFEKSFSRPPHYAYQF